MYGLDRRRVGQNNATMTATNDIHIEYDDFDQALEDVATGSFVDMDIVFTQEPPSTDLTHSQDVTS